MVPAKINATPELSFNKLLSQMIADRHTCGLVGYDDKVLGIVTAKDIMMTCQQLFQNDKDFADKLTVADVMHAQPFCLNQETPVYDALVTAKVNNLKHLPVINDESELVGLVSQTELLNTYIKLMDIDESLKQKNKQLQSLALEDGLMKIGSRHAMEIDLKYKEAEAQRTGECYSIALIDVDFFKNYNDHYGHQLGDDALRCIGEIIKRVKRKSDRVYRYGGEEILLIMNEVDYHGAKQLAERIRAAIEDSNVEHVASPLAKLTVSIGLCSQGGGHWKEMVKQADTALYQAKNSGRNQVI